LVSLSGVILDNQFDFIFLVAQLNAAAVINFLHGHLCRIFCRMHPRPEHRPVSSAMTPILIWEESSLLQPQMPSERIIKSTRRITDFFHGMAPVLASIFCPQFIKVKVMSMSIEI